MRACAVCTENIFLKSKTDNLDIVLSDFGLCKIEGLEDSHATRVRKPVYGVLWLATGAHLSPCVFCWQYCGTATYMAPEISDKSRPPKYTPAVDIWAAGVSFFYLLFAKKPFGSKLATKSLRKLAVALNICQWRWAFPDDDPEHPVSDLVRAERRIDCECGGADVDTTTPGERLPLCVPC